MSEVRFAHRGLVPTVLAACASAVMAIGCAGEAGPAGQNGTSCTVSTASDGTKTIACADGTTATVTNGTNGKDGSNGKDGQNAATTGTINFTVKDGAGAGISGATAVSADLTQTATMGIDGTAQLQNLKIGVWTFTITATDYSSVTVDVGVVAGQTSAVAAVLVKNAPVNPLKIAPQNQYQVGFNKEVTLGATVTGASANATYAWTFVSGPTTPTLDSTTAATPKFTTATLDAVLASGKFGGWLPTDNSPWYLRRAERAEWMAITSTQNDTMTYTFKLTVTDGAFTASANVTTAPGSWTSSTRNHPVGVIAVANDKTATTYNWALTTKPTGSNATLMETDKRNPWFIPDLPGDYTVTNSAPSTATTLTITAGNWGPGITSGNCSVCHSDTSGIVPANVTKALTDWEGSVHPALFKQGVTGIAEPGHYSGSCIRCHVSGYNLAANNGGFDDVAKTKGWTFPTTTNQAAWDAMPAEVQQLGSIQCENCHGPVGTHGSGTGSAPKPNLAASTCGFCHDGKPHHDLYSMWSKTGHADLSVAMAESGTTQHCGRCHFGQGYLQYSKNLAVGKPGNMLNSSGGNITLADLGVNADNPVEPITCAVCHEPHGTGLRTTIAPGAAMMLASGFAIPAEVGAGALCMSCHNTRNGMNGTMPYLHNDSQTNAIAPFSYSAPHTPSQADVLMGQNAYFVQPNQMSKHAAIEDTCVTCHMYKAADDTSRSTRPHTFSVDRTTVCAGCHGEGVTGEALTQNFEAKHGDLAMKVGNKLAARLSALVTADGNFKALVYDATSDKYSAATAINVAVTYAVPLEIHGQVGFTATLAAPVSVTINGVTANLSTISFRLADLFKTDGTTAVIAKSDTFMKAMWNYFLLHGDGSGSIHNPTFCNDVLTKTSAAVDAIPACSTTVTTNCM